MDAVRTGIVQYENQILSSQPLQLDLGSKPAETKETHTSVASIQEAEYMNVADEWDITTRNRSTGSPHLSSGSSTTKVCFSVMAGQWTFHPESVESESEANIAEKWEPAETTFQQVATRQIESSHREYKVAYRARQKVLREYKKSLPKAVDAVCE